MIEFNKKKEAYHHICNVHDEHIASIKNTCGPGCAECCTINVTLTSLEGCLIAETLERSGRDDLFKALERYAARRRFIPQLTLNQEAEKMFRGEPVPDQANDPDWGRCPLLIDNRCEVYEVRPFACRCLVSEQKCAHSGYALMPPLTLAVNQIMMQYIEHIDRDGFTGNLIDVLGYMRSPENRRQYREDSIRSDYSGNLLIRNHPARHLLVEPELRGSIAPVLTDLNRGG
jgi:Fe-S-cluster containining protein